jgi:hypothetical protein
VEGIIASISMAGTAQAGIGAAIGGGTVLAGAVRKAGVAGIAVAVEADIIAAVISVVTWVTSAVTWVGTSVDTWVPWADMARAATWADMALVAVAMAPVAADTADTTDRWFRAEIWVEAT